VVAAQKGFTFAEDAISLPIPVSATLKDRRHYMGKMSKLAQEGYKYAANTQEKFRDVRQKVLEVCRFFVRGVLFSLLLFSS
jgi:hypothetical protein